MDRSRYDQAWSMACLGFGTTDTPLGIGRRCAPQPGGKPAWVESYELRLPRMEYVWSVAGVGWPLKAAKDVAILALIVSGLFLLVTGRAGSAVSRGALPIWSLAGILGILGLVAVYRGALLPALAGFRTFSWVAVALVASALPVSTGSVAKGVVVLLGVQAALTPLELLRGLPLHRQLPFWDLPGRMAGTFVMPNSLGLFAAAGTAWVLSSGLCRGWKATSVALAVVLVALSSSGAGWVLLAAMACFGIARAASWPAWARAGAIVAACAGLVAFLPRAVNRPELPESLQSRTASVRALFTVPTARLFVGEGLGRGTNLEQTLRREIGPWDDGKPGLDPGAADSMVFSVLRQTGVVGVVLVGLAILEALRSNGGLRLFLLVASAGAVALNVAELFPLNVLFGLALGARQVEE